MKTTKFTRNPFDVDAVQVTAENIHDVAKWCQGEVATEDDKQFVKVRVLRVLNERQTKAFIGDWVLYAGTGYKVYTNKAFQKSFTALDGTAKDAANQAAKAQSVQELRTVAEPAAS